MAHASTMLELETPAPAFSLPNTNPNAGRETVDLGDYDNAEALLVVFLCNHCPYVIHIRDALVALACEYQPSGLATVAINSNDVANYPDDSPQRMTEDATRYAYPFAYLYDESQAVAQSYRAACTPDFFLFDRDRKLVYRGQFDGSRPGNRVPVTGEDLRAAADAVLSGAQIGMAQKASMGCNIKWKAGNEPDYFGTP